MAIFVKISEKFYYENKFVWKKIKEVLPQNMIITKNAFACGFVKEEKNIDQIIIFALINICLHAIVLYKHKWF